MSKDYWAYPEAVFERFALKDLADAKGKLRYIHEGECHQLWFLDDTSKCVYLISEQWEPEDTVTKTETD